MMSAADGSRQDASEILPLLNYDDVAALLGVSTRQVARWAKAGVLRARRLGRSTVRFDPRDVRAFIDSRIGTPADQVNLGGAQRRWNES